MQPISILSSTKNECCVDHKTASTVNADLIVKFGFSCLCDNTKDIDVFYAFAQEKLDADVPKIISEFGFEKNSIVF